jgi:hypothetical protein
MISTIYRAKVPRIPKYKEYVPPTTTNHYPPVVTHPTTPLAEAATRAAKLGITTIEWQRRDEHVRKLAREGSIKWGFMDEFYPCSKDYYAKYGKCVYIGSVHSYREIDHNEWPVDDNVMVFNARPIQAPIDGYQAPFICNIDFMQKEPPTE